MTHLNKGQLKVITWVIHRSLRGHLTIIDDYIDEIIGWHVNIPVHTLYAALHCNPILRDHQHELHLVHRMTIYFYNHYD